LTHAVDVLVIGAGLAGSAAALEAAGVGADVLVVDAGAGSSPRAQGGIAAAVGAEDAPEIHERDTLLAGAGACEPAAVRMLTVEAAAAINWLAGRGVTFDRGPGGALALSLEAAHARPRVLHLRGDATGEGLMSALEDALADRDRGVKRLRRARLLQLLARDGAVVGARLGVGGSRLEVLAGTTILATGGYAGLYGRTTNAPVCDGRGALLALAAGATLADLEFVQFHPTAYAGGGASFLITEALRGAGALLTDAGGRRFLCDLDPRGELAPRSMVARAIAEQLSANRRTHVLLDARPVGSRRLREEFPGFTARCRRVGIDPDRQPVPVAPAAHYTMGGVVTDLDGCTGVPGLLAAGECARTGVHGANRLASNSLLESVVFGRRAGRLAARMAGKPAARLATAVPARRVASTGGPGVAAALDRWAGVLRDGPGLERAMALGGLARLIGWAAMLREESRGSHARTDFPAESDEWSRLEVVISVSASGRVLAAPREKLSRGRQASA
jgi:L-aspartate oxidase